MVLLPCDLLWRRQEKKQGLKMKKKIIHEEGLKRWHTVVCPTRVLQQKGSYNLTRCVDKLFFLNDSNIGEQLPTYLYTCPVVLEMYRIL